MLMLAGVAHGAAAEEPNDGAAPQVFDAASCYQLVSETGLKIAWARWEVGAPEANVVARFDDETPEWIVDLTQRWIADAYHWQATEEQVRQWAQELGNPAPSHPDQLTPHQTMAIWLHRIARTCNELHT
jgi:hypothetical protein